MAQPGVTCAWQFRSASIDAHFSELVVPSFYSIRVPFVSLSKLDRYSDISMARIRLLSRYSREPRQSEKHEGENAFELKPMVLY